jgi:FtsP/CotA-like multicopper oxidase with cupredoxin domain
MRGKSCYTILFLCFLFLGALPAGAAIKVQCPGDTDGDAQWASSGEVQPPNVDCKHIVGGDGFATMADGTILYTFGFSDATGIFPGQVLDTAELNAQMPAPLITASEGFDFYLTLSTVPMRMRPDLFDPHTVHWHGFPNAAPIFDGEPMAAIAINPGASLTYYYKVPGPGTYMYHCHVEAAEHMQMGMLGNLYVTPQQDGQNFGGFTQFAYNDGDGSTGYDIDYVIQIIGFDPDFHNANEGVQPLPFAAMKDTYMMINGRGYPDTVNPSTALGASPQNGNRASQQVPSLITAAPGDRVLLRISNLSTVHFSTITIPGIPMIVVGKDAMILRSSANQNLYYTTNTLTLGGGQSVDVILDTNGITPGRYFLHTTQFDELSNNTEDFGGLMTEIVIQ